MLTPKISTMEQNKDYYIKSYEQLTIHRKLPQDSSRNEFYAKSF
jgi:hypothetical protein